MPIRLDDIPAPAARPALPRAWLWLGLLLVVLLLGLGLTLWLGGEALNQRPLKFWGLALGVPFTGWCLLSLVRALSYLAQQGAADGWDQAREEDLIRKLRQGRRSQQILAVSLYTALRKEGSAEAQGDALRNNESALKVQPVRGNGELHVRHSRLPAVQDAHGGILDDEALLQRTLRQVLVELAGILERLPADRPLALLLEANSTLKEGQLRRVWQLAWAESGIRQSAVPVEGSGLAAIDQWLDSRIHDPALLLVVALQVAPEQPEGTAEAVVGLLFGNRLTQATLLPLAYLHRSEQERKPVAQCLEYAARQALDWVPMVAEAVERVWLAGVNPARQRDISAALEALPVQVKSGKGLHDLGASLGQPGPAAPWVAIAAATEAIRLSGKSQFIVSGDGTVDAELWSTVVTSSGPLSQ